MRKVALGRTSVSAPAIMDRPVFLSTNAVPVSGASSENTGRGASTLRPQRKAYPRGIRSGKGPRILFVDDEIMVTRMVERSLSRFGCEVTACTSAIEAFDSFAADPHRFDAVVTDQNMPSLTGEMLAQKLLAIRPELPVILISGCGDNSENRYGLSTGIREWIAKPVDLISLSKTIERVCGSARAAIAG